MGLRADKTEGWEVVRINMRQESFLALHSEDPKSAGPGGHTAATQITYQHHWLLSSVMFITIEIYCS